ncbi:MAG: ComF family protein [Gammaproteobacteria bacterium]
MEIVRQLFGAVMPVSCLLCGAPEPQSGTLCSGCLADLPGSGVACPSCGAKQTTTDLCGRCQNRKPPYDQILSAYEYAYPVDNLIRAFKYRNTLIVAKSLTPALAERVRGQSRNTPQAMLPVPLHFGRLCRRGFNQSQEIARRLKGELGIPIDDRLLRRHKATREQALLAPRERRRNLRAAFSLNRGNPYRSVAIVDDVFTTGATVSELARLLRRTGTKEIQVWVLARA